MAHRKERILSGWNDKGYVRCELNGKNIRVHRLVGKAFVPNLENKPQINHIDGNKGNNHADNLEWCTNAENTQHAYDNGLYENRGINRKVKEEER